MMKPSKSFLVAIMESKRYLALKLAIFTIPTLFSMLAYASDAGPVVPPPDVQNTSDSLGVDQISGEATYPGVELSLGNKESGIERNSLGMWRGRDNFTGTVSKFTKSGTYGGEWLGSGLEDGTYLQISIGQSSYVFKSESGDYNPVRGATGKLTCNSSSCIFTSRLGSKHTFTKSLTNGYKRNYTHSGAVVGSIENIALLERIDRPDGEILHLFYENNAFYQGTNRKSISAVTSSLGWMLKYSVNSIGSYTSGSYTIYDYESSIKAINRRYDYCDPGGDCDSLSYSWPEWILDSHVEYGSSPHINGFGYITNTKFNSSITNPAGKTYTRSYDKEVPDSYYDDVVTYPSGTSITYRYGLCGEYPLSENCPRKPSTGKTTSVTTGNLTFLYGWTGTYNTVSTGYDGEVTSEESRINRYEDNLGRDYVYAYNDRGFIKRVIAPDATPDQENPSGGYTEYSYDGRGNITRIERHPKGGGTPLVTKAGYPSTCSNWKTCNKPAYIIDQAGVRRDFTYHSQSGKVESVRWPSVNGDRAEIRYKYESRAAKVKNSDGNLVNSSPVWKLVEVSKCISGYLDACVGTKDEIKTTFSYNSSKNLLLSSKTESLGDNSVSLTTTMGYDRYGNLSWENGPRPGSYDKKFYYYDILRNLIGEIGPDPDGSGPLNRLGSRLYYNGDGQVTQVKRGVVSSISLSALNSMYEDQKVVKVYQSGTGLHLKDKIYAAGSLKRIVQKSYDSRMRLQCEAIRLSPSSFGSLPSSACTLGPKGPDGNDRITKYTYDATDEVVSTIQGYGTTSQRVERKNIYRSDNGLLDQVEDGLGNTTFYDYDEFNRLEYTRYPSPTNGAVASSSDYVKSTYTGAQITSMRIRDGSVVHFGYDNKGRISGRSGAIYGSREYNNFDQVTYRTSYETGGSRSDVETSYNALGWKQWEKVFYNSSQISTVSYGYDSYGRRNRLTWPDGFYVTYDYNVSGYPSDFVQRIRENGSTALVSYTYDNYGRVSVLNRSNGVVTNYTYDDESRLELMSTDLGGTEDDIYEAFSYTVAGQLKSKDFDVFNSDYLYQPGSSSTTNYSVNDLNQLTSVNSSSVSYDGKGNLELRAGYSYTYLDNNLLSEVVKSGVMTDLVYDSNKRLFSVSKSGVTTRFVHDGSDIIAETGTNGSVKNRYIHGVGTDDPAVWYVGSGTSSKRYYSKDHQGSIVGGSYQSGSNAFVNAYDEYGDNASGNTGRYRYTGQIWLHEFGLYYYKARMYDPSIGRFLQTDPIGYEDQMNLYAYVYNDPVNATDPTGMFGWYPGYNQHADAASPVVAAAVKEVSGYNDVVDTVSDIENGDLTGAVVSASFMVCKACKVADKIEKNVGRFIKKVPANARDNIERRQLPNEGTAVQATSEGKVPGSKAVYEKQIDADGNTVQMTKTTYDPEGNIVHVKDKINNEEIRN